MKKLVLFVAMSLLICSSLQAKKIDGRIIFEDDTIHVIFKIPFWPFSKQPQYHMLQNKVKYYDASGKKKILKPNQAKEIQFTFDNQAVRMLSRSYEEPGYIFSTSKPMFLKLQVDGEVKMFTYYDSRLRKGGRYRIEVDLIQKGDGELKRPRQLTFRHDMLTYLDDCQPLSEKINSREFRRSDLDSIIEFYNANCGK